MLTETKTAKDEVETQLTGLADLDDLWFSWSCSISCLYISQTNKDEHTLRSGTCRVCGFVERAREWKGVTKAKATEMPSQPQAISCRQAVGPIIGCSKASVDMLQRKSYVSQKKKRKRKVKHGHHEWLTMKSFYKADG